MNIALSIALDAAVNLRILELRKIPRESIDEIIENNRDRWAETICSKGDVLQYRSERKETEIVFVDLVDAIACLSFLPGGIEIFGVKFEG